MAEAADQALVSQVTKKVGVFLDEVGIGQPGAEDSTSARRFDSGPMVRFAIDEGHYDEPAEEIYRLWVERQMEGAVECFDVVQSHLRAQGVAPKVELRLAADSLQLYSKEASGMADEVDWRAIVRVKKLVDGIGLEFGKGRRALKLECPQAGKVYQAIRNKMHEREQMTAQRRAQHFHILWDRIDEAVARVPPPPPLPRGTRALPHTH
jgi:hypothetical protein